MGQRRRSPEPQHFRLPEEPLCESSLCQPLSDSSPLPRSAYTSQPVEKTPQKAAVQKPQAARQIPQPGEHQRKKTRRPLRPRVKAELAPNPPHQAGAVRSRLLKRSKRVAAVAQRTNHRTKVALRKNPAKAGPALRRARVRREVPRPSRPRPRAPGERLRVPPRPRAVAQQRRPKQRAVQAPRRPAVRVLPREEPVPARRAAQRAIRVPRSSASS